jgi:hypothetical protein
MDDLNPEAQRMLELVRQAREPTAADKQRMDALITGSVAVGAAASTQSVAPAAARAATQAATHSVTKGATASLGVKAMVAAAVIGAGGLSFVLWEPSSPSQQLAPQQGHATETTTAPAASQPVPSAADAHGAREASKSAATLHDEELDLLHAAQVKWRNGDAKGALSQLEQHRALFPSSQLASERDALTALSLCALGRHDEGRALAERFMQAAPRSPLRATVEESCLK